MNGTLIPLGGGEGALPCQFKRRKTALAWRIALTLALLIPSVGMINLLIETAILDSKCTGGNECGVTTFLGIVLFGPVLLGITIGLIITWATYKKNVKTLHITAEKIPPAGWYTPIMGEKLLQPAYYEGEKTEPETWARPTWTDGWRTDPLDPSFDRWLTTKGWTLNRQAKQPQN